ncbi:MAG: acyl-CoA dehydrogenase family protein, partial [Solirubrobacterales bacterium]
RRPPSVSLAAKLGHLAFYALLFGIPGFALLRQYGGGKPFEPFGIPLMGGQGSMSKLKCGDVAVWATAKCMDLVGPASWDTDLPLEKWYRDAKIYQIFEGTSQIQRMVIGRLQVGEFRARLEAAKAAYDDAAKAAATPVPA